MQVSQNASPVPGGLECEDKFSKEWKDLQACESLRYNPGRGLKGAHLFGNIRVRVRELSIFSKDLEFLFVLERCRDTEELN